MGGDGDLTKTDVELLSNCFFPRTGDCPPTLADVNCNGGLTPADLVLELNKIFLGSPFPCS
ncbi:MAG: hypothetical protein ACRECJ_02255 [Limisphaerales bacterium]